MHQAFNQQTASAAYHVLAPCQMLGTSVNNTDPVPTAFVELKSKRGDPRPTDRPTNPSITKPASNKSYKGKKQGVKLRVRAAGGA